MNKDKLTKRLKDREVSEAKEKAMADKLASEKLYKVIISVGAAEKDKPIPSKAIVVKAKSKKDVLEKHKGALGIHEVAKDYKLPKKKQKNK